MEPNGERMKRLKKACNNFYVINPFDAMLRFSINAIDVASHRPGGYFHIRRSGGLDLTSSLEAKFGARSGQVHQIRGKTWDVLSPQDAKVGKSPNFGVISEIQRAKFGVFVTYIFGGKI